MTDPMHRTHDHHDESLAEQVRRAVMRYRKVEADDDDDGVGPQAYSLDTPRVRHWPRRTAVIGAIVVGLGIAAAQLGVFPPRDTDQQASQVADWDTIYALREVTVRANAGTDYDVLQKLDPGALVKVHRGDHSGWVLLYDGDGRPIGYAYRTRASFGPHPPPPPPASFAQPLLGDAGQAPAVSDRPRPAGDTTAVCRDGAPSFSRNSSGTCSGHGGVLCWIHHPGPSRPTSSPFCTVNSGDSE